MTVLTPTEFNNFLQRHEAVDATRGMDIAGFDDGVDAEKAVKLLHWFTNNKIPNRIVKVIYVPNTTTVGGYFVLDKTTYNNQPAMRITMFCIDVKYRIVENRIISTFGLIAAIIKLTYDLGEAEILLADLPVTPTDEHLDPLIQFGLNLIPDSTVTRNGKEWYTVACTRETFSTMCI